MTPLLLRDPPLDPSADEARSWLRRELLNPEYHQQNVLQQILAWLQRQVEDGLAAAQDAPPLSTFAAMVVLVLLVLGLGWLLSRARWSARTREEERAVLTDEVVTAAELRRRAEAALAEGRHEDAVVDGFRALAVRQVERGRLDDAPGATAHEVAASLAATYPHQRPRVAALAVLFESVLYGDRPATRDQAHGVLDLDNELAGLR
ncbi:MAG: integral rane protein [Nocardioides sp.]|nr:integral rane protein [Nocardioides sp.]